MLCIIENPANAPIVIAKYFKYFFIINPPLVDHNKNGDS